MMWCRYAGKDMICNIIDNRCIFSKYCNKTQSFTFNERLNIDNCSYKQSKEKEIRMKENSIANDAYRIKNIIKTKNNYYRIVVENNTAESKVFWFKEDNDFIQKYIEKEPPYVYIREKEDGNLTLSIEKIASKEDEDKPKEKKAKKKKKKDE